MGNGMEEKESLQSHSFWGRGRFYSVCFWHVFGDTEEGRVEPSNAIILFWLKGGNCRGPSQKIGKLVVLRLPLHNKNNSSAIAHPTLFHFPHSFTPSLSPYQNAQCNARRSRASSQHAIPYSRPWLGLLLGAAHSLGGHGRANHNLTGPFDLGVKFDGDIAAVGDIPVLVIAGAGGSLVSLESCQAMASKLLNSLDDPCLRNKLRRKFNGKKMNPTYNNVGQQPDLNFHQL
ncbi:hypothetical protein JHK85_001242 [Glycine max]|nr:hypothetical protein JHK85_001242 [Glycine max]